MRYRTAHAPAIFIAPSFFFAPLGAPRCAVCDARITQSVNDALCFLSNVRLLLSSGARTIQAGSRERLTEKCVAHFFPLAPALPPGTSARPRSYQTSSADAPYQTQRARAMGQRRCCVSLCSANKRQTTRSRASYQSDAKGRAFIQNTRRQPVAARSVRAVPENVRSAPVVPNSIR